MIIGVMVSNQSESSQKINISSRDVESLDLDLQRQCAEWDNPKNIPVSLEIRLNYCE